MKTWCLTIDKQSHIVGMQKASTKGIERVAELGHLKKIVYIILKRFDHRRGRFHATGTPKMQSQKCNFTILQLQDFLVNYELYEMLIPFGFYI